VKLYLDENLSPRIAELLRARGLDAVIAHEAGNTELADHAQLRYATSRGRAIEQPARGYPHGIPGSVLYLSQTA